MGIVYSPFKSSLQCFTCFLSHKELQTFGFGIRVRCGVGGRLGGVSIWVGTLE